MAKTTMVKLSVQNTEKIEKEAAELGTNRTVVANMILRNYFNEEDSEKKYDY